MSFRKADVVLLELLIIIRKFELEGGNHVHTKASDANGKTTDGLNSRARLQERLKQFKQRKLNEPDLTKGPFKKDPFLDKGKKSVLSERQPEVKSVLNRRLETCAEHDAATKFLQVMNI